jgi:hypothetical protein
MTVEKNIVIREASIHGMEGILVEVEVEKILTEEEEGGSYVITVITQTFIP